VPSLLYKLAGMRIWRGRFPCRYLSFYSSGNLKTFGLKLDVNGVQSV
jgi:hypothetical protein